MDSMNQPNNEAPGIQLPPPIMEQVPSSDTPKETSSQSIERRMAAGPEQARMGGQPAPSAAAIPLPMMPDPAGQASNGGVSTTTTKLALPTAKDSDLIEKEWVNKAKHIVDSTRDDPYRQSEQLTEVKVDYMKQRYGKTIKLSK
jgi:hypothetical protein